MRTEQLRNALRARNRRIARLEADVADLMVSVEENRRLNERLSDVLDVLTELLVPAAARDDAQVQAALTRLQQGRQQAP